MEKDTDIGFVPPDQRWMEVRAAWTSVGKQSVQKQFFDIESFVMWTEVFCLDESPEGNPVFELTNWCESKLDVGVSDNYWFVTVRPSAKHFTAFPLESLSNDTSGGVHFFGPEEIPYSELICPDVAIGCITQWLQAGWIRVVPAALAKRTDA